MFTNTIHEKKEYCALTQGIHQTQMAQISLK